MLDETLLFPKQVYGYVFQTCCAVLLGRIVAYDEEVLVRVITYAWRDIIGKAGSCGW